ncbi:MAG: endo-1,4-beta-xylanase [Ruminococcus sp.]
MKKSRIKLVTAGLLAAAMVCSASPAVYAVTSNSIPAVSTSKTAEDDVIFSTSFEDGEGISEFSRRGEAETIELKEDDGHTGSCSMIVGNREQSWNGPQFLISERCEANTEYIVSAWVKTAWYTDLSLSMEYTDTEGERHYSNLKSATSQGDWVEISETKISFTEDMTNVYVYFEGGTADIQVDDFVLKKAPVIPIEEDIPSLKDVYAGYFKVGTAITPSDLSSPSTMALVNKHFSGSITVGNEMKPDYVLDKKASLAYFEETGDDTNPQVTFSAAKSVINYCIKNNIPLRAHTLVWHSQTPDWFFKEGFSDDGDWVDKETMLKRMENYIKNFFETLEKDYPELNVYACDVVNEAWTDQGTPRTAGSNNTQSGNSAWVQVFGDNSFIEPAFEYARKYAPAGCKLYYNDYNEYMTGKVNAIVEMAESLKAKGLIDGIGMQSHLDVRQGSDAFPSAAMYKNAIAAYAATGLDIQVTELDATIPGNSDANYEAQAQYYSDIMDAIVEYKDSISAVVVWGITDDASWRATQYPLLFDANFKAKPAFYSIIDGIEALEPVTTTTTTGAATTTTTTTTTTITSTTEPSTDVVYGDADLDGKVGISDVVKVMMYVANKDANPITEQGLINSDVYGSGDGVFISDALSIQKKVAQIIDTLPES